MPTPLNLPFDPIERAAQAWSERFGPAAQTPAMAAVTSLMRVQQILLGQLDAALRPHGLTFARYEALVLLTFSRHGALPLSTLGQRLMVHPTSVTNTVDRLQAQGLIRRRPSTRDRRVTLAEITDAGRGVVAAVTGELTERRFGLTCLDDAELATVSALLRRVRVAAGDFVPPESDENPD